MFNCYKLSITKPTLSCTKSFCNAETKLKLWRHSISQYEFGEVRLLDWKIPARYEINYVFNVVVMSPVWINFVLNVTVVSNGHQCLVVMSFMKIILMLYYLNTPPILLLPLCMAYRHFSLVGKSAICSVVEPLGESPGQSLSSYSRLSIAFTDEMFLIFPEM